MEPQSFKPKPQLSEAALTEKLLTAYSARSDTDFIHVLDEWLASPLPVQHFDIAPAGAAGKVDDQEKEDYILQIKDQVLAALKDMRDKQSLSALDDEQKRVLANFFIPLLAGLQHENDEMIADYSRTLGDKAQHIRKAVADVLAQAVEEFEMTGTWFSEDEVKKRLDKQLASGQRDAAYHLTAYEQSDLALRIAGETFIELCDKARLPVKSEYRNAFGGGMGSPSP